MIRFLQKLDGDDPAGDIKYSLFVYELIIQ